MHTEKPQQPSGLLPSAEDGDFDCPKAQACRSCECGFCRALRKPAYQGEWYDHLAARENVKPAEPQQDGGAVAWGAVDKTGTLWVCDFGLATITKEDAEYWVEWSNRHQLKEAPFMLVPFYTTPQPQSVPDEGNASVHDEGVEALWRGFRHEFDGGETECFDHKDPDCKTCEPVVLIRESDYRTLAASKADSAQGDLTDCGHSKYDPCHNCEPTPHPEGGRGEAVTDADVEAVEQAIGMSRRAWDMVDPKEIIAAARRTAPPYRSHSMTTDRSEQSGPEVVARQAKMSNGISVTKWGEWPLDKEQEPMIGRWSCEYRDLITLASHQQAVEALRAEVDAANDYAARCTDANTQAERDNDALRLRAESAEARLARVAGLPAKWREVQAGDDCTLYTMGERTGRTSCALELAAVIAPQDDTNAGGDDGR